MPAIPCVVCTALGAVVAFLTPIGHHGSLLILGPGQYRFADFLRIGAPLTILLAFVCAWMTQWLWLGGPLLPFGGGRNTLYRPPRYDHDALRQRLCRRTQRRAPGRGEWGQC